MPKLTPAIIAAASMLAATIALSGRAAAAHVAGDVACGGQGPAVQVRVVGFKQPIGTVKVAIYRQENFLKKKGFVGKVKVPVRSSGPMDVCLAVPGPGRYAVAVHHDLNGNRSKDRADGGGFSRNPHLSVANLRPPFASASFDVNGGTRVVAVRLQYLQGLRIAPIQS